MMLNSINEETRLSLLCENFAYLSSEERAGILFTTADDVNVYQPKIFFDLFSTLGSGCLHNYCGLWREEF